MTCNHQNTNEADNCIQWVPIFSNLTYEEMLEVANITHEARFDKGSFVYMANDLGGKLFVLHKGKVKISRIGQNGKEQVLRIVEAGEFIGELNLFSSTVIMDNAEVLEPSTMCLIEVEPLKALMAKYPSIAFKVMEVLSQRLNQAESLIENINLYTVEQRVAHQLLHLSEGKRTIHLKMSKGDLASQMGMSQETLSRKLTNFQELGWIELDGQRTIYIKDKDALEKCLLTD